MFDIPFSFAKADFMELGDESSSVLGNLYVGLEYAATSRFSIEFGGRAPLTTADAESFADVAAIIADPERAEAFLMDVLPMATAAVLNVPVSDRLRCAHVLV